MQLRIIRNYKWESTVSIYDQRIGGENPVELVSYDTLQYLNESNEWVDVDIVQGEIPEHPSTKYYRELEEKRQTIFRSLTEGLSEHAKIFG